VLAARPWPSRLHGFVSDHVPDIDLVVVRDQRAALEAKVDVLVVDDTTPWLTPSFVAAAGDAGIQIVGIYDRTDAGGGKDRLAQLGLTHLMEAAMPPDDAVFLLERLRPTHRSHRAARESASPQDHERADGRIVAVGGPSGSGAREVAVALAAAWAARGSRTVLVDLNETTPGVARRLGLPLYPHVLAVAERLAADEPDAVLGAAADLPASIPFDVIVGLPSPRDWDRLMTDDVDAILSACSGVWDRVVVATGPIIEDMQRWADRFGVSRHALASADAVVGCCEPSPRGVLRFTDWAADVRDLRDDLRVVVNKVPRSHWVAAEVRSQLADVGGSFMRDIDELPLDRRVEAAEWDGQLVTRGPFTKAVARVASSIDSRLLARMGVVA
jgi:CO dehydrogenase nickel-insertion accessory protein CooC1